MYIPLSLGGRLLCRLLRGPFVYNLGFIGVVKGIWVSKTQAMTCLYENFKNFLMGPFVFNLGFIGLVKCVWGFKNKSDERPF